MGKRKKHPDRHREFCRRFGISRQFSPSLSVSLTPTFSEVLPASLRILLYGILPYVNVFLIRIKDRCLHLLSYKTRAFYTDFFVGAFKVFTEKIPLQFPIDGCFVISYKKAPKKPPGDKGVLPLYRAACYAVTNFLFGKLYLVLFCFSLFDFGLCDNYFPLLFNPFDACSQVFGNKPCRKHCTVVYDFRSNVI